MCLTWQHSSAICHKEVATDYSAMRLTIAGPSSKGVRTFVDASRRRRRAKAEESGRRVRVTPLTRQCRARAGSPNGSTNEEGGIHGGETVAREPRGLPLEMGNSLALRGAEDYCIPLQPKCQHSIDFDDIAIGHQPDIMRSDRESGRRTRVAPLGRRCRASTWMCKRLDQTNNGRPDEGGTLNAIRGVTTCQFS
jgi:hypothetical protein